MIIGGVSVYNKDTDFFSKFKNRKPAGIEFKLPDSKRQEMSLDEYKRYLKDKLSRISQYAFLFADISDEGYLSMKNDPDYEERFLSSIEEAVSEFELSGGNIVTILHVRATEDESYTEKIDLMKEQMMDETDEEWWDERMKRMIENIRLNAAVSQKRSREQREITKELVFAERLNSAERQEEILKKGESAILNADKNSVYAKAAIAAYRANLLIKDQHII